jgi:hypothetical protein
MREQFEIISFALSVRLKVKLLKEVIAIGKETSKKYGFFKYGTFFSLLFTNQLGECTFLRAKYSPKLSLK